MRFFLFLLLFSRVVQGQMLELVVNAESAILINAKTGRVLFEQNGYAQAYPASTTKIATALLVLEKYGNHLDRVCCADREAVASITPQAKKQSNYRSPPYWLETDGTHVGIKRGEEFKLIDLLHLTLIASGNDAANVIAHSLGGTIPKFMQETNEYLQEIGCKSTHYNNPHGLHHPQHVTTAYDLALMSKVAMRFPVFEQIVSSARFTCPQTNLEMERHIIQTNHLLRKGAHYYPKAIGIKTGFTSSSGKNLVAAARDEERVLIAVALGYRGARAELYQDVTKMFETAFAERKYRRTLLAKGMQKMVVRVSGARTPLKTYLAENLTYEYYPSEESPVKVTIQWQLPALPIAQGAQVGLLQVVDGEGNLLEKSPLFAAEPVEPKIMHHIGHLFAKNQMKRKMIFLGGMVLLLFIFWRILCRKK